MQDGTTQGMHAGREGSLLAILKAAYSNNKRVRTETRDSKACGTLRREAHQAFTYDLKFKRKFG